MQHINSPVQQTLTDHSTGLFAHYSACDNSAPTMYVRKFYSCFERFLVRFALLLPQKNAVSSLIAAFALTIGITQAFSADLVVLDNAAPSSLMASTNADVIRTLNIFRKQVEQYGSIRIIIGLRIAFTPEGGLTAAAAIQQRNEIARVQTVVLGKVPSLKQRPETIKRFIYSPFMALEVTSAELEALASLDEITSFEGDQIAAPSLGIEEVMPESK